MKYENVKKENSQITVKVSVEWSDFDKAITKAYNKTKNRFAVQGFRKGKAPRNIIERQYGQGVFYEEAVNIIIGEEYPKALDELSIEPVARPDIDIEQIEAGKPFVFTALVTVKPEVALENYKGLEVERIDATVTEELVDAELNKMAEMNSRIVVVDRAVEDGDTTTIDYKGFVGEEQFEGGTAEGHELVIGSGSFIPGFEEQLIGAKTGEEVEVKVTFPEEYHSDALAGKDAIFKVMVHEVKAKELPVLDDEFAKDTSEFDTIEDLKANVKKELTESAEKSAEFAQRDKAIEKVVSVMEVEIPEAMIEAEVEGMLQDLDRQLQMQGLSLEMYTQFMGGDQNALKEQMRGDAETRVKTSLAIEKVVELENFEITDEEVEAEFAKIAEAQNVTLEEVKKVYDGVNREYIESSLKSRKAVDLIVESAVLVDPVVETEEA